MKQELLEKQETNRETKITLSFQILNERYHLDLLEILWTHQHLNYHLDMLQHHYYNSLLSSKLNYYLILLMKLEDL